MTAPHSTQQGSSQPRQSAFNSSAANLKTGLIASTALISAVAGLSTHPAQASTYGPLPLISADQLSDDTCYMRDEAGLIVDLTWLCNGGQGTILPTVSVSNPYRKQPRHKSSFRSQIKVSAKVQKPLCQTTPEFSDEVGAIASDLPLPEPTVEPTAKCKPPAIQITGGKNLEAIQELSAPPSNPYGHLGF